MPSKPITWTQPPLIVGGYELVTMTLTMHLDGPAGSLTAGWSLEDTATGAWIAAEVTTMPQELTNHGYAIGVLTNALERAERVLRPF